MEEKMGEKNPENKEAPVPMETKPQERPDLTKEIGKAAIKGATKK
jgi:hypothetical protein